MLDANTETQGTREIKEWTLMFYFASDNPLAISIVSQLKALKAAGYHPQANVIAQFDPFTEGTPTHIFDVNVVNKLTTKQANVGFAADDTFVRNLLEDKLWRDQRTRAGALVRDEINNLILKKHGVKYEPPIPPNGDKDPAELLNSDDSIEQDPDPALRQFLEFCCNSYPARHYMLFILGHGVVVGNDVFLLDEHADTHSLKLTEMGRALRDFKECISHHNGQLELLSFHSCSVSSLEVAYELQNTARYMLASEGPTFVGSWPYRQILVRIFKDLKNAGTVNVDDVVSDIFFYCLFNSTDFLVAGYSHQLTLCDLSRVSRLNGPMEHLALVLKDGLKDPLLRDYIQLAHLKSQSFFQEMYTDLRDFCFCLSKKLEEYLTHGDELSGLQKEIFDACNEVMDQLVPYDSQKVKAGMQTEASIIVRSAFAGPSYQYSHGLSVYFPWAKPSDDRRILTEYANYRFSKEFKTSWLDFLHAYFNDTMRLPAADEGDPRQPLLNQSEERKLQDDIVSLVFNREGPIDGESALAGQKSDPNDRTGGDCDCPSIKNYPRDTRSRGERGHSVDRPIQSGGFEAF